MRKAALLLGTVAVVAVGLTGERQAKACGGCFHEPNENDSPITDHRMVFSVSPTQTTLYDQVEYQGSPSSFAWVLPIHGTVDIGLSADVLFAGLDSLTQTQVVQPTPNCPAPPNCGRSTYGPSAANGSGGAGGGPPPAPPGVMVTKQQIVGPYATVQLSATDPMALETWLSQNNYNVPASVQPVIAEYVNEGFGFLAMKLVPGAGVQAMRPVRVTTPGAGLSLPLRMVAAGTGATVGVTLWVISDGRYEPQNFPFFHIDDSQLVWDWSTNSSNFKTLRLQNEQKLGGRGWEVESALSLAEVQIQNIVLSGGQFGGGGPPAPAANDYQSATTPDGGTEQPDQVRTDDLSTLFAGMAGPNVTITRLRSDLAHSALDQDLALQASADQSMLSNIRIVTQQLNAPLCPIYGSDCGVIGYGPAGQGNGGTVGGPGGNGKGSGASSFACSTTRTKRTSLPAGLLALGAVGALIGLVRRGRKQS